MITEQFNSAIELIRHPERMDRSTIPVIQAALEQYPYYQTLHLLLLQNMYKVHDPRFSAQLKKSAVMVVDRSVLFDMVEGVNYSIPITKLQNEQASDEAGDKTLTLIDNFLSGVHELPRPATPPAERPDPLGDYSLYLEQLPDFDESPVPAPAEPAESAPEFALPMPAKALLPGGYSSVELSEEELEEEENVPSENNDDEFTVASIRQHLQEDKEDYIQSVDEDVSAESDKKDYFTETMATIYIKQKKYEQALEIIRTISAENPKKSVYFADQMRYLELLIRINKNKTK